MKKLTLVVVLLTLAAMLLAACGAPPAPPAPTAGPEQATPAAQPAQPAQPPTAAPQVLPTGPSPLSGQVWQWTKTIYSDGKTIDVPTPANYTIEFMPDGKVVIKADCNNAIGEFMTDGQSLQIMIGGVTRAMCPPGSLSEEFLKELSEVNSYVVQGDSLTMTTVNGTLTLVGGQAATAPQQPPSTSGPDASLEGPTWNWIKTEYSNDSTTTAPDPTKYTLLFDQATKRFIFVADCNNGSGSYTLSGASLTMKVEGMTRAMCPPPSDEYVKMLDQVASYKIEGSTLYLALKFDTGIMVFTTGGAQPAPGAGSGGATTPPASSGSNLQRLQSGAWKWQQSADSAGQTWNSPNPANYTIQFNPDGTLGLKLDCNTGGGSYQADETNLTIQLGFSTLMACPPPTLDSVFQQQLAQVSSYFFDGNDLILLWKMDSGSMKFSQ